MKVQESQRFAEITPREVKEVRLPDSRHPPPWHNTKEAAWPGLCLQSYWVQRIDGRKVLKVTLRRGDTPPGPHSGVNLHNKMWEQTSSSL